MILLKLKKSDSKIQGEILSLYYLKDRNFQRKPSIQYIQEWAWRNKSSTVPLTSQLVNTSMFSEETV